MPKFRVDVEERHRNRVKHQRTLTVRFEGGKRLTLMLDPGIGYWEMEHNRIAPAGNNKQRGEQQIVIATFEKNAEST